MPFSICVIVKVEDGYITNRLFLTPLDYNLFEMYVSSIYFDASLVHTILVFCNRSELVTYLSN